MMTSNRFSFCCLWWSLLEVVGTDCSVFSSLLLLLLEDSGVLFEPFKSCVTLWMNAASRSSRKTMQHAGTQPMSMVSLSPLIHKEESETTYINVKHCELSAITWVRGLFLWFIWTWVWYLPDVRPMGEHLNSSETSQEGCNTLSVPLSRDHTLISCCDQSFKFTW